MPSSVRAVGNGHDAPDTGKEEKPAPRPLEGPVVDDRQVKFDDKNSNWEHFGNAFVMTDLSGGQKGCKL